MLSVILGVIGVVLCFWMQWRIKNKNLLKASEKFPGPPAIMGVGNALQFMCTSEDLVLVVQDLLRNYGDVLKFWLGPDLNIVINNPDDVKNLLTNPKTSWKGQQYKYMKKMVGEGILSGSGLAWRKHRKLATPNFSKRATLNYFNIFNKEAACLVEKFRQSQNIELDMHHYIGQMTCYTGCQTLFGLTREQTLALPKMQKLIDVTPRLNQIIFDRMTKWYLQIEPIFWMTGHYREEQQGLKLCREFTEATIKYRKEYLYTLTENHKNDLMQLDDDTNLSIIDRFILSGELTEKELNEETLTLFTTSQDSVAEISSFTLTMCAFHPKVQEKLYREIRDVFEDSERDVTDEDLKKMPYLDMVLKETLRLFPAAAMMQRTALDDIPLGDRVIPKGCSLVFPVYHLQRDPRYWDNPNAFNPERFSPENITKIHPGSYLPFSLGPMDCLGRFFATTLIKTLCIRVLREFQIETPNKYEDFKVAFSISVVTNDGHRAIFRQRKK